MNKKKNQYEQNEELRFIFSAKLLFYCVKCTLQIERNKNIFFKKVPTSQSNIWGQDLELY